MSIYRRFDAPEYPSFITTTVAGRRPIFRSEAAATSLVEVLYEVRQETAFRLLAFVIMPDHLHIILKPPSTHRLGQTVQLIKGRFARRYNQVSGGKGPFWQSRYYERALRSESELLAGIEYIHQNPVAAGLATDTEMYPWSSLNGRYPTDLAAYLGQAEACPAEESTVEQEGECTA